VAAGTFRSGLSHFIQSGYAEGRSGNPAFGGNTFLENAVSDSGGGNSTVGIEVSENNPLDYITPANGGVNEWKDSFGPSTADIQFLAGQITQNIPLQITDDGAVADGDDTIVWTISDSAPFGFSQETYTFSENNASIDSNGDSQPDGIVGIELSLNSSIKTATIIIEDNDSDTPTIIGDADNNVLNGSDDNEAIYAREGDDYIDGLSGNDNLYGEPGNDTLLGYFGNDYLNGGSGNDYLDGEADNDILEGLTGNDSLYGGAGNDSLLGYAGSDYLNGGEGADIFGFYSPSEGIDTITDFAISVDQIQVSTLGFGIDFGAFNRFIYDSSTGALSFFNQDFTQTTQFALLQPNLGFDPSRDISIVNSFF
jgi:Ca2+-binding RTX toxin-like protein